MHKLIRSAALFALVAGLLATPVPAQETPADATKPKTADAAKPKKAELGKPAIDFELPDLAGKKHKLSAARGKIIVLEWFNPDCPFVNNAHQKGSLKGLAARYLGSDPKDVVWLAINSGAPGKQGHTVKANQRGVKAFKLVNPILRDESGTVGRTYRVTKSPTLVIIDQKFNVVYFGGEDNTLAMRRGEADKRVNHVDLVIGALRKGEKPPISKAKPFG